MARVAVAMKLTKIFFIAMTLFLTVGCTYLKSPLSNAGNGLVDKRFSGTWAIQAADPSGKLSPLREQKVTMTGRHIEVAGAGAKDINGAKAASSTGYLVQGRSATYLSLNNSSPMDPEPYLVFKYEFKNDNQLVLYTTSKSAVAAAKQNSKLRPKPFAGGGADSPVLLTSSASETLAWLDSLAPTDWELHLVATRK